jgi:hypothetical protein
MNLKYIAISSAAFVALSAGAASAQLNSGTPPNQRCWDPSTNQVRDRSAGTSPSYGSNAPAIIPAPGRSTSNPSGIPNSPTAPGGLATRPPEGAGLPNC